MVQTNFSLTENPISHCLTVFCSNLVSVQINPNRTEILALIPKLRALTLTKNNRNNNDRNDNDRNDNDRNYNDRNYNDRNYNDRKTMIEITMIEMTIILMMINLILLQNRARGWAG